MIKNVILDLDDTIFDFHAAEKIALTKTLTELGIAPTQETTARYSDINASLWKKLELGELRREEVLVGRFVILFRELNVKCDALSARKSYENNLSKGHIFIEGAESLLQSLFGKYKLFLASNGTAAVQIPRIESSGIEKYFEAIYISELVGFNKPDTRFFERIFANIEGFSKDESIIVGDSISSDIVGGKNAGIKTCLYNPRKKAYDGKTKADFEIHELKELIPLIEKL